MELHRAMLCQAAELVETARKRLDTRTERCSTCGLTHYVNREHWKQAQELDGMLRKLKRLSNFSTPE